MPYKTHINTLIGKSPDEDFYNALKNAALSHEKVRGIHDLIGEYIGPNSVHVDFDLELDPSTQLSESDIIVRELKRKLSRVEGLEVYCSIHPCSHTGDERRIAKHI